MRTVRKGTYDQLVEHFLKPFYHLINHPAVVGADETGFVNPVSIVCETADENSRVQVSIVSWQRHETHDTGTRDLFFWVPSA